MGPVQLLRKSTLCTCAYERSIPSGIEESIIVRGIAAVRYVRSMPPTTRAPAIPTPLGCTRCEACASVSNQETISARILRSLPHLSAFDGSLIGLSGSELGLLHTSLRYGAFFISRDYASVRSPKLARADRSSVSAAAARGVATLAC